MKAQKGEIQVELFVQDWHRRVAKYWSALSDLRHLNALLLVILIWAADARIKVTEATLGTGFISYADCEGQHHSYCP